MFTFVVIPCFQLTCLHVYCPIFRYCIIFVSFKYSLTIKNYCEYNVTNNNSPWEANMHCNLTAIYADNTIWTSLKQTWSTNEHKHFFVLVKCLILISWHSSKKINRNCSVKTHITQFLYNFSHTIVTKCLNQELLSIIWSVEFLPPILVV